MSFHPPATPDPVLKPRDLGQVLDQNFKVFGRYWRSLVPVGLVAAIPSLVAALLIPGLSIYAVTEFGSFPRLVTVGWMLLIFALAALFFFPLYQGALIDVSTRAVLHMEPVPLGESFRVAAVRYWPMLGTYALLGLIWILAIPALILAGLVVLAFITVPLGLLALATLTVFSGHAVIVEQKGALGAIGRAFELGKSRFWPLLGTGIVYYLLSAVLSYIVIGPVSFAAGIATAATESLLPLALTSVVEALVTCIITPFMSVGLTLVYFDTRIRKEGYDLETMARQQAEEPAPADFQP